MAKGRNSGREHPADDGAKKTPKTGDDTSTSDDRPADDATSMPEELRTMREALATMHIWHVQAVRDVLAVLAVIAIVWVGYAMRAVTVPLLIAMLLAYLFEPVVQRVSSHPKIRRPFAVGLIIAVGVVAIVAIGSLAIPLAVGQTARFADDVRTGRIVARIARLESAVPEPWRDDYRQFINVIPGGGRAMENADSRPLSDDDAQTDEDRMAEGSDGESTSGAQDGAATPQDRTDDAGDNTTDGVEDEVESDAAVTTTAATDDGTRDDATVDDDAAADDIIVAGLTRAEIETLARAIVEEEMRAAGGGSADSERQVLALARGGLQAVWAGISAIIRVGFLVVLIPFYFFFFSLWYQDVLAFCRNFIPKRREKRVLELLGKMDSAVAGFVRGRIVISIIMGVLLSIGWLIVGVPYSIILGMVSGLFCSVPYLGFVGVPAAVLLLLLEQFGLPPDERMATWAIVLWPVFVFFAVQMIEGYLLIPTIAGKATNLDPVTILVAVLAGASVLGVYGMLLAIPLAACAKILVEEVVLPRLREWAEGRAADPLPIDRD